MAIEFYIDAKDRKRIEKMLSTQTASRIGEVMFRAFQQAGAMVEGKLKENVSGPILNVRSSRLINSIGSIARVTGDQVTAEIGSGARGGERVPYAGIHETGGTIRPTGGRKNLTIPIGEAKTKGGDLRGGFTARKLFDGEIPGYDTGVIIKNIVYGKQSGGKNKFTPLFVLVKSVTMPARKYLSRTLEETQGEIPGMVLRAVANELRSS